MDGGGGGVDDHDKRSIIQRCSHSSHKYNDHDHGVIFILAKNPINIIIK